MELQWKLLGDSGRNTAFFKALEKIIKKGETTISDIGSGTGFLSFLAVQLGARECFLYEQSPELIEMSKKLAAKNGIKNLRFIAQHSAEVKNPVKTDLVICETLGNYALEENILETLRDAKRFLKPDGLMMPQSLEQFVAPVTNKKVWREINIWDELGFNIDMSHMQTAAINNMYVSKIKPADLLDGGKSAQKWDRIDFRKNEKSVRSGNAKWKLARDAVVYGFAVWWKAELAPGITLSTAPHAPKTHWDQIFLPLPNPLHAKKYDTLELAISSDSRYEVGINVAWKAELKRKNRTEESVSMDMRRGILS